MLRQKIKTLGFSLLSPLFALRYRFLRKYFPKVYSSTDTLNILISSGKSFARFGDGELNLIGGRNIGFQESNIRLAEELRKILNSNSSSCLIGLPNVFHNLNYFRLSAKYFWLYTVVTNWRNWRLILSKDRQYLDSLCSRFYLDRKNKEESRKILKLWKKLWNNKDLVIIEGEHTKMGIGNDLFSNTNSIKRIVCPPKNAFNQYPSILSAALKLNRDVIILIALGPTASILAFDLSKRGYQAIDTGHLDLEYCWMLSSAKEKVSIPGRLVNEVDSNELQVIHDMEYEKQVICKI